MDNPSFLIPPSSLSKIVAHLNIIGFRAAVAAMASPELRGQPYVIAGGGLPASGSQAASLPTASLPSGRAVAWDVSPQGIREGLRPGMTLAAAQRLVKNLRLIPYDYKINREVNGVIEGIITRYAPAWQNDGAGNIYLDITGTRRLFGPPADCICHIQNEITASLALDAAAATAANKLVCKVASRTIRPEGLIEIRAGDEESFLAHQDITLLPGMGPSLMKTIRVTGFREAGELAALTNSEAEALFGKKGILLRDLAKGIDNTPVGTESKSRIIEKQADFAGDVLDETVIRGAIASLAEHCGIEMRKDKLGAGSVRIEAAYGDGGVQAGCEKVRGLLVLDSEITAAAGRLYQKTATRRIRIRSVRLSLENFSPLGFEPDLFEPESAGKERRLQEAVDVIQLRYGAGKVMRGMALAAMVMKNERLAIGA